MKRIIGLCVVLLLFPSLGFSQENPFWTFNLNSQDLWFPGATGSKWMFQFNDGAQNVVNAKAETEVLDGKEYKKITSDKPFMIMSDDDVRFNPFLTFRVDKEGRLMGFGKDINQCFENPEKFFEEKIKEKLELSYSGIILKEIKSHLDEWVLMDFNRASENSDHKWTVAIFSFRFSHIIVETLGLREDVIVSYCIIGEGLRKLLSDKDHQIYRLTYRDSLDGMPAGNVWIFDLISEVGIVKMSITDWKSKEISVYDCLKESEIIPIQKSQPVEAKQKIATNWGGIKSK